MFDSNFEVIYCNTWETIKEHFRVRYEVYCKDTGFEDPKKHPTRLEYDRFDGGAVHFLARCKTTGDWVGALRLVPVNSGRLPLSEICSLDQSPATEACFEVSRVCILPQYRKKLRKHQAHDTKHSDDKVVYLRDKNKEPEIMLGLIRAAYVFSKQQGVSSWFALYKQSLARILKGIGFNIEKAGPQVEHRGLRAPYKCKIDEFLDNVATKSLSVFDMFGNEDIAFRLASELPKTKVMDQLDLNNIVNGDVSRPQGASDVAANENDAFHLTSALEKRSSDRVVKFATN